jgi:lantibiotic modifying enzyme
MQLFQPERHEPLTTAVWDEHRARSGVDEIVAATLAARRQGGLWSIHPADLEDDDDFVEPTTLWIGASGVVWALAELDADADLAALAELTVERYVERPDFGEEFGRGLWMGEAGVRLVALRVTGDVRHASRLLELVRENAAHRSNEIMWGAPGTMIAARAAHALTGDAAFLDAWEESAQILLERQEADGLWTQWLRDHEVRSLGPAHGFSGNVRALLQGGDPGGEIGARAAATAAATAIRDDGLANWPPAADGLLVRNDQIRVQWCHGAPGIACALWDVLPLDLLTAAGELTWRAGPLRKGFGLCHGTAGNGYAFLKVYGRTQQPVWLDRARAFAMHALEQAERARAATGVRPSLWMGDVGVALYLRSCLEVDHRYPTVDVW